MAAEFKSSRLLQLSSGISLNVLKFDNRSFDGTKQPDIVVLPGLGSVYEINARILDQADPKKLARTVVDVATYKIWDDLSTVDVPVLVIGVSHDRFHSHDEASNIAQAIPGSSYTDIETNKRSHSAEVADIIAAYLKRY